MDTNTLWQIAKPIVAGQLRTALAGAAGTLAAVGAIKGSDATEFVSITSGIVMYAIPVIWSAVAHYYAAEKTALLAKSRPIVPPTATTGEALAAANSATIVTAK
jgi:hypothetical protein